MSNKDFGLNIYTYLNIFSYKYLLGAYYVPGHEEMKRYNMILIARESQTYGRAVISKTILVN